MFATAGCYPRFLMSTETELLTVFGSHTSTKYAKDLVSLLGELGGLAPSAAGQLGIFNSYGRIYLDGSHLELAAAECDSPMALISMIRRQELLLATALDRLRQQDINIQVANCNHSGLLTDNAATWGSHENYLVKSPPDGLADLMLPFLVTRLYTGAGGVHFPTGNFLAGVRLHFLNRDRGGGTMNDRAIHSTARSEHLNSNPQRFGYRYHILLGDGLRSEFSQLLRFGTTALVLEMLEWEMSRTCDSGQTADCSASGNRFAMPTDCELGKASYWMRALRHFNVLAVPGAIPNVHPLVCRVQRSFLSRCDRFYAACPDLPPWVGQVLTVWDCTLSAMERQDVDWLSARLDPWIKYRLMSTLLEQMKLNWSAVPNNRELHERFAILNQDYHDFTRPESVFQQLNAQGGLRHQIVSDIQPGGETEPFVPETGTRATARARFLKDHAASRRSAGINSIEVDWCRIFDSKTNRLWLLDDPFATECKEILPSH